MLLRKNSIRFCVINEITKKELLFIVKNKTKLKELCNI